ncbi:MAG: NAD(P)-dependent oxidoreductase [Gammaproteobacteria bacterium]|nr:MAG: NAD(P)-dependent oxidoreductase [Gammaproteobacteria bacterium]
MKPFAVIGASSGTGLALVKLLEKNRLPVRAISRKPRAASEFIEPFAADVTDIESISKALTGDFSAVFFTVDIHGFNSRATVRKLMYQGFINTIQAAAKNKTPPKIVLLSVIGSEISSWVWWILNAMKPGMQKNIIDRENALKESGLAYVICRAPKLNDDIKNLTPISASSPNHKLTMNMGISRENLARALLKAAKAAPENTTWDIIPDKDKSTLGWL